jgi:hypothetical protein
MSEQNKISFAERFEAFKEEWIEFIKKELTNNIEPWFYVWFSLGSANADFINKMRKLVNKHFRGIITDEAFTRLNIFVKHLQYGIMALRMAIKDCDLETHLKFVESFCKESFDHMSHWNWLLTDQDMSKLEPYREEDMIAEPEFDKEKNGGYPSWIKFSVLKPGEKCDCGCEDDGVAEAASNKNKRINLDDCSVTSLSDDDIESLC